MASFWNTVMQSEPRVFHLEVDGVDTRVVEAGPRDQEPDSETVMLIHGASGHLESFVHTLAHLAPYRRTIAFDLPWHGHSGYPSRPYDVFDYAHHLAGLARELRVTKVALVGQSLGGAIAARATVEGLLDVQRLVLIGSAGVPGQEPAQRGRSMRADLTSPDLEVVRGRLEYAMLCRGPQMEELIECRYLAYQLGDWEARVEAFTYHEHPEGRARTQLSENEWGTIACPTLLIWGDNDKVVPPAAGETLARLVDQSVLSLIPECGHNPQFERPDVVNPQLQAFLCEE